MLNKLFLEKNFEKDFEYVNKVLILSEKILKT
jgi:hypothetical protein